MPTLISKVHIPSLFALFPPLQHLWQAQRRGDASEHLPRILFFPFPFFSSQPPTRFNISVYSNVASCAQHSRAMHRAYTCTHRGAALELAFRACHSTVSAQVLPLTFPSKTRFSFRGWHVESSDVESYTPVELKIHKLCKTERRR